MCQRVYAASSQRYPVQPSSHPLWSPPPIFLQLFGDSLLRSLLSFGPAHPLGGGGGGGGGRGGGQSSPYSTFMIAPPDTREAADRQSRACRQLADFLGCPDDNDHPRLRVLRLLLAATSLLGRPFRRALRQGPLWTALLRLATGRDGGSGGRSSGGVDSAGRTYGGGTGGRGGMRGAAQLRGAGIGGKAALGPTNVLARDVVVAVREDRGSPGTAAEPRQGTGVGVAGR